MRGVQAPPGLSRDREDREAKPEIPLIVPNTLARAGLEGLSALSLPHQRC